MSKLAEFTLEPLSAQDAQTLCLKLTSYCATRFPVAFACHLHNDHTTLKASEYLSGQQREIANAFITGFLSRK